VKSPPARQKVRGAAAKPRQRRPQAERSAETRKRLIDAAIACLARFGYSVTTVSLVADQAKLSRGAMTHQYPAKVDLMVDVVKAVYEMDAEHYRRTVAERSPTQWLKDLPQIMWDVIGQPSGIAVIEIMLASRSDRNLAGKLRALQQGLDKSAHHWVVERLERAGLKDPPDGDVYHLLFVAAVRGLLLESMFRRDRSGAERSVAVLKEVFSLLYPGLAQAR
jgi:AcrR family transcriptional regulator